VALLAACEAGVHKARRFRRTERIPLPGELQGRIAMKLGTVMVHVSGKSVRESFSWSDEFQGVQLTRPVINRVFSHSTDQNPIEKSLYELTQKLKSAGVLSS
jgi:hypothetical protein